MSDVMGWPRDGASSGRARPDEPNRARRPRPVACLRGHADVIAFHKDPDAPLMTMEKPGLTVHPVVGDLFETVGGLVGRISAP